MVLGCGSNVIDVFYQIRRMPQAGEKSYFDGEKVWLRLAGAAVVEGPDERSLPAFSIVQAVSRVGSL
jgi:hypothetical protein